MKSNELREKAITMLQMDTGLFIECVNELDNWNGYADGYRAFTMGELDDFYCGVPATKLLQDMTADFNIGDDFFYFTIWGLESTNNVYELYRDNTTEEEVLDNLIDNYNNITIWGYDEFDEILEELVNEG